MINIDVEVLFTVGKPCMLQIFADQLNLTWENSLSIVNYVQKWRSGACRVACTCFIIEMYAEKEKLILQADFIES